MARARVEFLGEVGILAAVGLRSRSTAAGKRSIRGPRPLDNAAAPMQGGVSREAGLRGYQGGQRRAGRARCSVHHRCWGHAVGVRLQAVDQGIVDVVHRVETRKSRRSSCSSECVPSAVRAVRAVRAAFSAD
eukprot:1664018-Pyramimonas_sp.AAC.1